MPVRGSVYEFGAFRLDSAERLLLRAGQTVPLTPKAFDLLVYLLDRHGRLVTKQELLNAVWPDTFVEEANLTYTVSALRKALGDGQEGEQFIQTVPTRGYRFLARVIRDDNSSVSSQSAAPARSVNNLMQRVATIALAATVVVMLPVVVGHCRETPDERPPVRLTIAIPDTSVGSATAPIAQISPDGSRVAFVVGSVPRRIWIQRLDAGHGTPVSGTEEATSLFWSPDSRQLGFTTVAALKKLTIADGTIETLCADCNPGRGGTWSRNGFIVFVSREGMLLGVRAAGGKPATTTTVDGSKGEVAHISPHFLPDGDRFLYVIRNADASRSGLYVGQVGSAEGKLLLQGEHPAIYVASGHLLFNRAGNIAAAPFDLKRLELTGDATPLVRPSEHSPTSVQGGDATVVDWFGAWPSFSASNTGVLTYSIAEHPESQFQWFRRTGEPLERVGVPGPYMTFDLSPDNTRLVFARRDVRASLWVLDLPRNITSPLTFGAFSSYSSPRWGPSNQWVAAHRPVPPPLAIVKILPDGQESIVSAVGTCVLDDVSQDGGQLLCRHRAAGQLLAVPLRDGGKPLVVRTAPAGVIDQSQFSPDGAWVAYNADESGQYEVYVVAFPSVKERWPVSHGGGVQPVWRQDGRELYYLGLDGALNAVALRVGDRPQFSPPSRLFDTGLVTPSPWVEQYAVSADGQRVLILTPVDDKVRNSIGVILNWTALLQRAASD